MRKVKVPEKRLTPEELENALVEFAKSPPDIVDETEFRARLRTTTIARYKCGAELLDEVKEMLRKAAEEGGLDKPELRLAVKHVDDAICQMTHGALAFNKGAPAEGVRNLLQITRAEAEKSAKKKT
jgi:hypothetical protein